MIWVIIAKQSQLFIGFIWEPNPSLLCEILYLAYPSSHPPPYADFVSLNPTFILISFKVVLSVMK